MFMSQEQREARRIADEKRKQLTTQLDQRIAQRDARIKAQDAEIEAFAANASQKWEYAEFSEDLSIEKLNVIGSMGWELVNVTFYDHIRDNYRTMMFRYTFKRKLQTIPSSITDKYTDLASMNTEIESLQAEIERSKR